MNRRWGIKEILWGVGLLVFLLAIWGQYQAQSAVPSPPPIQTRTILLRPDSIPVTAGGLTGRLEKLRITEQVEHKTGKIIGEPDLKGILQLKNTSTDQAVRPFTGTLEYADGTGAVIPLAKDQGEAEFTIYVERRAGLRPGEHTSEVIDVPFPVAALKANTLHALHLHLTYLSTPYATATINGQVVLGQVKTPGS